jgi:transposase
MEMPLYRELRFLRGTYGDATLSRTTVFKWHKAFKEGQENVEDDPRSGRPVSSTNDQTVEVVRAVMVKDCRLSVRMIAEQTGLDKNAVHRILTEHLHMRKICAKNTKTKSTNCNILCF